MVYRIIIEITTEIKFKCPTLWIGIAFNVQETVYAYGNLTKIKSTMIEANCLLTHRPVC